MFFDDARVPVANLLGEEGQGWNVAMATAGFERGLMLRSPARFQHTARKLVELYREPTRPTARPGPARRGRRLLDATPRPTRWTPTSTVSRLLAGGKIGAEASLNKIFWSELDLRDARDGPRACWACAASCCPRRPRPRASDDWLDGYLFALSGPIYAGTNEIQRNVIAERLLGLPRRD